MKQKKKVRYVEKKPPDITNKAPEQPYPEEKPEHPEEKINQGRIPYQKKVENRREMEREKPKYVHKEEKKGKGDICCIICSEEVAKRQSIWTCGCCCISLHLSCMREWIKKVNGEQNKRQHVYNWKCPQCNHQYCEPLPKYYCFCGKLLNPEYDPDLPAHSCGDICDKKRGPLCPHPCPLQCHPGKCPPCNIETSMATCQCGKTQRTLRCSEDPSAFQCGKKCEKLLNCGTHKCQRNCHPGPCQPCKKKKLADCHCGNNSDVIDCSAQSYSCGEICGRLLDCGFHKCEMKCHSGPCQSCPHTPELQTTCPCGKYSIEMLTGDPEFRKSCQDPIPICGMPCQKKLDCGHVCPNSCHEGPCPPCKVIVDQSCSCGLQTRKIACHLKEHSLFKCEAVCKRKRSCGNHLCNEVCCPNRNSPFLEMHPCQLTCNKPLNCGKHDCGEPCHLGLCKKCPVVYSQPQPCPCGQTFLKPPIICGTLTPQCDNICGKELPCGHKCSNVCHYGPCKCYEQVQVSCRCGRETITTTCGREALCLRKCDEKLPCGHPCGLQCHRGTCEEAHKEAPCRKHCNKERKNCGHICQQLCHPGKACQDFPCEAEILVKCECGHRQAMTLCGAQDQLKTRKSIVCNKKCQNLKRFDILYKNKQIYYSGGMVQFAFKNYPFLQHLEDRLERFVLRSDENFLEVQYKFPDNYTKLILTDLFENHYHLNTHFYRHHKYAAFTLMQGDHTMIPKPILSEYVKLISSGKIKQTNLPFEFTITFQLQQRDKVELILKSLSSFLHKYYTERNNNKFISLHFWSKEDGEHALNQLQNQFQTIEFKCAYNIAPPEEEVDQKDIVEVQHHEEGEKEKQKEKQPETKTQEKYSEGTKPEEVQKTDHLKSQKEKKIIPSHSSEQPPKKISKPQNPPKLIVRNNIPTFRKNDYPPSSENVQDIYLLDQQELFGDKVDWQKYIDQLCSKKMSPEATEWKIRTLFIINSFFPVQEKYFQEQFADLIKMYNKDKQAAMRILEIQRIDNKSVKKQMEENGIYISHHEPQILSYLRLYNFTAIEKIELQYPEILMNTPEVTKSLEIIEALQTRNLKQFYNNFKNSDFVFSCALIPIVHCLREIVMEDISKGARIPVNDTYKYLLFNSQQELQGFFKQNGLLEVGTRVSKSTKEDIYILKSGELRQDTIANSNFIKEFILEKRDKKYFLLEPEELYQGKYLTLSCFAFGDFKESIIQSYMNALVKLLKAHQ